MSATILVIEDELDLATGLQTNLELEGHRAVVAHTGEEGLALLSSARPDLVILDLMLPGMGGFSVLEQLRRAGIDVPVLILSARVEEVDKVRGFRTGADDYVTKPFGVMELMLRVQAMLRRGGRSVMTGSAVRIGSAQLDPDRRLIIKDGQEHAITPRAFELIMALFRHRDRVVTRQELLRDVWGYSTGVTTRTVDAHIAELRKKIEDDPAHPRHILTVWKTGYRLRP